MICGFTIPELLALGVAALIPILTIRLVWPMLNKDEPTNKEEPTDADN